MVIAMQSLKHNPSGLPRGTGSLHLRGNVWWVVYRDEKGHKIEENSHTADPRAARRLLAARALERVRAVAVQLERIAYGKAKKQARAADHGQDHVRDDSQYERGHRPVRNHATQRRNGRKKNRGGKA